MDRSRARCVEWARGHAVVSLLGNHDAACAGLLDLEWFNPWARESVEWTIARLSTDQRLWLKSRPHLHRLEGPGQPRILLAHGTPREPVTEYVDDQAAADILAHADFDLALVGHTHLMGVYTRRGYTPFRASGEYALVRGEPCLVNIGSVGQPRDGSPLAGYVLVDLDAWKVILRRIPYDVATVQRAILDAGLPPVLAERLATGR
ncbi:MAG: metallophosphoesterase family protein [Limnochordaceae bacterium]|nr:metallophosphoesterase family protein [Limnochordaceae bacterium]